MKLAVITGCDSGIGKSLSQIFADNGYSVIISYLKSNPFKGKYNFFAKRLDLTKENQIISFASFVKELCEQGYSLDFFINNAGIALGGPFENIPLEIYRKVFEVNFFGLLSVTQKITPYLIKSKGRLVIIGSMAGRIALPFLSPYVASKFALEGFCDSIRREFNPLGIRTILIEPGGIATPIWNKALEQDSSFVDKKYRKRLDKFQENFISGGNQGMSTDKAAEQIFRFITKKNPSARYIVAKSRLASFLELLIPNKILDTIILKLFPMDYDENM